MKILTKEQIVEKIKYYKKYYRNNTIVVNDFTYVPNENSGYCIYDVHYKVFYRSSDNSLALSDETYNFPVKMGEL